MPSTVDSNHIVRLLVSNFCGVEAQEIELHGESVLVMGDNATGKTSLVNAILWALGAITAKDMDDGPVRNGTDKATVRVELGWGDHVDLIVERTCREGKKPVLSIRRQDEEPFREPDKILKALLGNFGIRPQLFFGMNKPQKRAALLRLMNLQPPEAMVQEITGTVHKAQVGEDADKYLGRLCDDENGFYYLERRRANQNEMAKLKALQEETDRLTAIGGPPEEEKKSATAILDELERMERSEKKREELRVCAAHAKIEMDGHWSQVNTHAATRDRWRQRKGDIEHQIAQLQMELVNVESQIDSNDKKYDESGRLHAFSKNAWEEATALFDNCADNAQEIVRLRTELKDIEKFNERLEERRGIAKEVLRLATDVQKAKGESEGAELILKNLRDLRYNMVQPTDLGINGLRLEPDDIYYNGVALGSCSTGEQLDIFFALEIRAKPDFRTLLIDEGERFGPGLREAIFERARKHGCRVFMTAVSGDAQLKIEIREADG